MKRKLSTQLSTGFALIVLVMVSMISLAANFLISNQFQKYVEEQQRDFSDSLANALSDQYNAQEDIWNLDYIHGFGMYALNDGYVIKLYNIDMEIVWDAENHDMTLCHQIMDSIRFRMQEQMPNSDGDFVTHSYELKQNEVLVGYVDISYYSPYYFDENAFQFVDSLNQILVVIAIVSLIGAVVAGVVLARHISGPIIKTIEITREISDGNYKVRFASDVKIQELNRLTQSVNHMAEMLEEQDTIRKRLTTDVAHELRTPLANVSSHLEAIIDGVWEPTPERLQNCYDELGRISNIISDLEHLSRIENENLKLNKEDVDLLEISLAVQKAFESKLTEKNLTCTVDGSSAVVSGDRGRLYQVVFNLISNAVKYSAEGKEIRIIVSNFADKCILTVEDQGIGIPKEDLSLIFERFYRTDRSRYRKTGGAGIGLTITKAIVQAHGGRITAESEEGNGSRFIVTLPKD